jgi:hypothetical protein
MSWIYLVPEPMPLVWGTINMLHIIIIIRIRITITLIVVVSTIYYCCSLFCIFIMLITYASTLISPHILPSYYYYK